MYATTQQAYVQPVSSAYLNEHSLYSNYQHQSNQKILKKNFAFGILVILQEILICFLYGFLFQQPYTQVIAINPTQVPVSFAPIFSAFSMYMLVLVGFALIFSYNKRLIFSGLGFTLLITILSIQWYFLINAFWTKANFYHQGTNFKYADRFVQMFLANRDGANGDLRQRFNASMTDAVRCGLANSVAFSAILGRAGLLQAFFVSLIGTIGYELNRKIIQGQGMDYGHTFKIFIYAGFMGLIMGLMLRFKQKKEQSKSTLKHIRYTGSIHSGLFALLGTAFIFVFFPMIVMDPPTRFNFTTNSTFLYTSPISIIYGIGASTVIVCGFSYLANSKLMIRDLIYGPVAGAIAVASASPYISNPVWAMITGSCAGIIQAIGNHIQLRHSQNKDIINTVSFILFGVQGIVGSAWTACWRAVIGSRTDNLIYDYSRMPPPALQFASGWISAAMGIGFGIITGIFVMLMARHQRSDHFDDYTYWQKDDGIRYEYIVQTVVQQKVVINDNVQIGIKQNRNQIKQRHAYL